MSHYTLLYSPKVEFFQDTIVIKDICKKISFEKGYIYPQLRNMVLFFYEEQLRASFDNIIRSKFQQNPFFKDSTTQSIYALREYILQTLHHFSNDIIFPETIFIDINQYKSTLTMGDNLHKMEMHFECLNDFFEFSSNFLKEDELSIINQHDFSNFVIWLKDLTDQIQYVNGDSASLYEQDVNKAIDCIKKALDK